MDAYSIKNILKNGKNTQAREIQTKALYLLGTKQNSRKYEVGRYIYIPIYLFCFYIFQIN